MEYNKYILKIVYLRIYGFMFITIATVYKDQQVTFVCASLIRQIYNAGSNLMFPNLTIALC